VKSITGSASARVRADQAACFALLAAVDRYDDWNPDLVRELEVLSHDKQGRPERLNAVLHVKQSPIAKDFELTVAVRTDPSHTVHISRLPNEPTDEEALELVWRIEGDGGGDQARLEVRFEAQVSFLPRFLPVGGVGDMIARALMSSAVKALQASRT
jgi:ribosome-associated toxin RatA of RatAB toxin-antitoxin module